MYSVLISIRDFLLALALAWVGITLERPREAHRQPTASPPAASCAEGQICTPQRPQFDALSCDDK